MYWRHGFQSMSRLQLVGRLMYRAFFFLSLSVCEALHVRNVLGDYFSDQRLLTWAPTLFRHQCSFSGNLYKKKYVCVKCVMCTMPIVNTKRLWVSRAREHVRPREWTVGELEGEFPLFFVSCSFFFLIGETNISRILECRHETVICYSFIQFLLCDVVVDAQTMALEHVVVCLN